MIAGQGQTLMDVAVTECGAAELAWEIAVKNGLGLTDMPGDGELEVPTEGGDPDTAKEMAARGARPATNGEKVPVNARAIGYAKIGTDRIC